MTYKQAIRYYLILKIVDDYRLENRNGISPKEIWRRMRLIGHNMKNSGNTSHMWRLAYMGFLREEPARRPNPYGGVKFRFLMSKGKRKTLQIFRDALLKMMLYVQCKKEDRLDELDASYEKKNSEPSDVNDDIYAADEDGDAGAEGGDAESSEGEGSP